MATLNNQLGAEHLEIQNDLALKSISCDLTFYFLLTCSLVENEISDGGAVALAGYVSTTNTLQQFR